jgi:hypothetical protein
LLKDIFFTGLSNRALDVVGLRGLEHWFFESNSNSERHDFHGEYLFSLRQR